MGWWSSSEYRSFKIHLLCFQLPFSYQTSLGYDFGGFHHYATLTLSPLKLQNSKERFSNEGQISFGKKTISNKNKLYLATLFTFQIIKMLHVSLRKSRLDIS